MSKHFLLFQYETIHLANTHIQSLVAGEYAVAYSVSFEAEIEALPPLLSGNPRSKLSSLRTLYL
ncbi:hypothetical protein RFK98_09710 [Streptococcus suis]|uniref:hypothetical protein n=1 Tax=Streptococcus suis TaxID=1307 RepID=UPI002FCA77D1